MLVRMGQNLPGSVLKTSASMLFMRPPLCVKPTPASRPSGGLPVMRFATPMKLAPPAISLMAASAFARADFISFV